MRHLVGVLHLVTAVAGFGWSVYFTMLGLYGVAFSWWTVEIFIGSLLLLVGAIACWATPRKWARWIPLIGSSLLAVFFLTAFVMNVAGYLGTFTSPTTENLTAVGSVALVVASLAVAIRRALTPVRPATRG
jgi:cell division protein FtsW (lipid II flippase)